MCGLVAIIGDPSKAMYDAFAFMLNVDVIRGEDSTGAIAVRKEGVFTIKDAVLPPVLLETKEWKADFTHRLVSNYALIGHNRKATKGTVNAQNAHPFSHGNIAMVHNGTLHTDVNVDGTKFGTDSEGVAYAIARKGIAWTWERVNGAAALIWHDDRSDRVSVVTNGKRPLFFAYTEDEKHVFIASEIWMIEAAANRYKFDLKRRVKDGRPDMRYPADDCMFQFKWDEEKKKVEQFARTLEPYKVGVLSRSVGGSASKWPTGQEDWRENDFWEDQYAGSPYIHAGNDKDDWKSEKPVVTSDDSKRYEEYMQRHAGQHSKINAYSTARFLEISRKDFRANYHECVFCGDSLKGEYDTAIILDDNKAACESCCLDADNSGMDVHTAARGL